MTALTPSEDLVLEVLVARYRCGESTWTFERRHRRVAERLAERGLVGWQSGIVENTILVWLTDAGRDAYTLAGYAPPAFTQLTEDVETLRGMLAMTATPAALARFARGSERVRAHASALIVDACGN